MLIQNVAADPEIINRANDFQQKLSTLTTPEEMKNYAQFQVLFHNCDIILSLFWFFFFFFLKSNNNVCPQKIHKKHININIKT